MMRKKLGLVLGSGVGHAIADVGVIKALQEADVPVDLVVGTSGGSIVGALYAAGYDYRQMEEVARGLRWHRFFRFAKPDRGLLSSKRFEEYLDKHLRGLRFSDLRRPLYVVASDLVSGDEVVLNSPKMSVARAVVASCAMPILFQPVEHEGMVLVDGAVRNKLAVDVARKKGAETVLAVTPKRSRVVPAAELQNVFQLATRLIGLIGMERTRRAERLADVLVELDTEGVSPWDLKAAVGLIESAERKMLKKLPLLLRKLKMRWWTRAWRKLFSWAR